MNIIYENILSNGSIIASPTKDPDYNFHWVRDSAIIINSLIENYNDNNKQKYLTIFENYIDIELKHIEYHAAEPKFYIDGKPFLGEWGRPQNDGPALRGIVCLKLITIVPFRLSSLLKIINNDLKYTIENLNKPCYDLWEEIFGYHLYTRIIQYVFLCRANEDKYKLIDYESIIENAYKNVCDHFSKHSDTIFSSYTKEGLVLREYDSSILLAFSFLNYDIPKFSIYADKIDLHISKMIEKFNDLYPINKQLNIPFLGRYVNDKYFNGNPWIISTIALFNYLYTMDKLDNYKEEFKNFLEFLKLDKQMILSEQINKKNGTNISVEKLTWNYAELYVFNSKKDLVLLS